MGCVISLVVETGLPLSAQTERAQFERLHPGVALKSLLDSPWSFRNQILQIEIEYDNLFPSFPFFREL